MVTDRINKKEISDWVKKHPLFLKDFDLNNDGNLDDYEITNIHMCIVEYLSKKYTHKWFHRDKSGTEIKGPTTFSAIPKSSYAYVQPEGSKLWMPMEILNVATKNTYMRQSKRIDKVLISTADTIHGYKIVEHKGLVWGVTVRAKNFFTDVFSGFQNLFGGEVDGYTQLAIDTKQQAVDRLITSARRQGANAIIRLHFDSGGSGTGASEVTAYGTAVVVEHE